MAMRRCSSPSCGRWRPPRELSITDYGAVPGRANNVTAAFENGKALYDAMRRARKGDTVVVPAGQRFVMVPYAPLYRLEHVELRLEGCLAAFEPPPGEHAKVWPFYLGNFESLITIHLSSHVTISGGGALDGRGHNWWVAFARNKLASKRPMLLQIDGSTDVVVARDITMLDAIDAHSCSIGNASISRLSYRQARSSSSASRSWRTGQAQENLQKSVPMFPFNTDGIDVAGKDITIRDIVVSNYDDVVAVKTADLLSSNDGRRARLHPQHHGLQHHGLPRRRPVGVAPCAVAQALRPRRVVRARSRCTPRRRGPTSSPTGPRPSASTSTTTRAARRFRT